MNAFKHLVVPVKVVVVQHSSTLSSKVVNAFLGTFAMIALALVLLEKDISFLEITVKSL